MRILKNGFTLIELIIVIVLLGILSAIAIPKYVDLAQQARRAANQNIFRLFAEQMDKAHIMFEIKKREGEDLDLNLDGQKELRFHLGYPVGAKPVGESNWKELTAMGSADGSNGEACIAIFKAVIEESFVMQKADFGAIDFDNCGGDEGVQICAVGSRQDMSNAFECKLALLNTYKEADEDFAGNRTIEAFNYYNKNGLSMYAYTRGNISSIGTMWGGAFANFDQSSNLEALILLGSVQAIKDLSPMPGRGPTP